MAACELIWPRVCAGYILAPKFKALLLMQAQTMQSHLSLEEIEWIDSVLSIASHD
jgi:hypothetical protein